MPVVFHSRLEKALHHCKDGDKILILPGTYVCESLPWIDSDIEITGITGKASDVILQSSLGVGDIFFNCNANALLMSHLTLKTIVETQCIVMVHKGITNLVKCVIDSGNRARNTIIALSRAEVAIDDCTMLHKDHKDGIIRRPGSNVTLDGKDAAFSMEGIDSDDDNTTVSTGI